MDVIIINDYITMVISKINNFEAYEIHHAFTTYRVEPLPGRTNKQKQTKSCHSSVQLQLSPVQTYEHILTQQEKVVD